MAYYEIYEVTIGEKFLMKLFKFEYTLIKIRIHTTLS